MRALRMLSVVGAAAALAAPAWAQGQAVTGTVQTTPKNRQFVILSQRDGRFTVDAKGARFRRYGKVVALSTIRPGLVVTAYGQRSTGRVKAKEVCICPATPRARTASGEIPGTRVAGYRSGERTVLGVTGTIVGPPKGTMLTVMSQRDGRFTVDAAGATVRRYGRMMTFSAVKPGLVIRAYGTRSGSSVKANEICICPASPTTQSRTAGYRGTPQTAPMGK